MNYFRLWRKVALWHRSWMQMCVICRSHLLSDKGEDDIATVGWGIESLIEFSKKYSDVELTEYLMSRPSVVKVHNSCRRTYTNKRKFEQFSARTGPDVDSEAHCKSLRSQKLAFSWKLHCFFCNAPCVKDERHPHRKPTEYRHVETFEIRQKVLDRCAEKNDSWSHDVQSRLLVSKHCRSYAVLPFRPTGV